MFRLAIFIDWLHLLIMFEIWILQLNTQFLYNNMTVIKIWHDKFRACLPFFGFQEGLIKGGHVSTDISTFQVHSREGASFS